MFINHIKIAITIDSGITVVEFNYHFKASM